MHRVLARPTHALREQLANPLAFPTRPVRVAPGDLPREDPESKRYASRVAARMSRALGFPVSIRAPEGAHGEVQRADVARLCWRATLQGACWAQCRPNQPYPWALAVDEVTSVYADGAILLDSTSHATILAGGGWTLALDLARAEVTYSEYLAMPEASRGSVLALMQGLAWPYARGSGGLAQNSAR